MVRSKHYLEDGVGDTSPDVDEISKIPRIRNIICKATSLELCEIVSSRVKNSYSKQSCVENLLIYRTFYHTCILYIEDVNEEISHVHKASEKVMVPTESLPFKFNKVLNDLGLKHLYFFSL